MCVLPGWRLLEPSTLRKPQAPAVEWGDLEGAEVGGEVKADVVGPWLLVRDSHLPVSTRTPHLGRLSGR